jgi:hypothetical protein
MSRPGKKSSQLLDGRLLQYMSPSLALFGRGRRVGEGLLLREERSSGLRGPISVFGPEADSPRSHTKPMVYAGFVTGQRRLGVITVLAVEVAEVHRDASAP